jgi:hypothetical protein
MISPAAAACWTYPFCTRKGTVRPCRLLVRLPMSKPGRRCCLFDRYIRTATRSDEHVRTPLFGGWRFLFIFAWIESLQDLIIRSRRDSTSDSKALQLMDKVARV